MYTINILVNKPVIYSLIFAKNTPVSRIFGEDSSKIWVGGCILDKDG